MPKFHFRLATLLQLREATRDERRVHLAEAYRADVELEHQQARLEAKLQQLLQEYRTAAGPGAVDLSHLVEADQYAAMLRTQEEELRRRRQVLAAEIVLRRQALLEADRDVRTLEKLRENQSQAHRQEDERQEGKRLDEAALQTGRT
jgi:flagellar protein FliJ